MDNIINRLLSVLKGDISSKEYTYLAVFYYQMCKQEISMVIKNTFPLCQKLDQRQLNQMIFLCYGLKYMPTLNIGFSIYSCFQIQG